MVDFLTDTHLHIDDLGWFGLTVSQVNGNVRPKKTGILTDRCKPIHISTLPQHRQVQKINTERDVRPSPI